MENDEEVRITDFENPQVIYDLVSYVEHYASSDKKIVDLLCDGKAVEISELRRLLRRLFDDDVMPHFDKDGNLPEDMLKLEDLLASIGGQL